VQRQSESLVRRLAKGTDPGVAAAEHENGGAANGSNGSNGARPAARQDAKVDAADSAKADLPERFDDRAMIAAAYPLLYGRAATEEEVGLGIDFLTEQRASWLRQGMEEAAKTKAAGAAGSAPGSAAGADAAASGSESPGDGAAATGEDLAARTASMKAWVQYARALMSAAEFRYID
jgi:hypothetical protein